LQEQLAKTKGATVFAITNNIEKDADGVPTIVSRLAIVVKRKLVIYSWHDAVISESEVSITDPKLIRRSFPCQIERER